MTTYDVFLSHASFDQPVVEALARRLREDGIDPFLDQWHLVPGEPWQEALEDALAASRTCAVFVGREIGPWQNEEMRDALDRRARDPDFRVIPVLLPGAPAPEDLPRFLRRLTSVDFRHGTDDLPSYERLVRGIRGVAPGTTASRGNEPRTYRSMAVYPDGFVERHQLDEIAALLTAPNAGVVGITTALRGAGGFGKTTLAQALAHDERVRRAYPDGVLWTTLGDGLKDADRVSRVLDLIRYWTRGEKPHFDSATAAGAHLRELLAGQRVLLVVDDVWSSLDVEPFRGLEAGSALIITTRNRQTLPSECEQINVDAMRRNEAVELLAFGLDIPDAASLGSLAEQLGEWPLLLKLVNRQLRDRVRDGGLDVAEAIAEVVEALNEEGLAVFDRNDENARELAVRRTLEASLGRLPGNERHRFAELAIFPEDVDIPLDVLERFWQKTPYEAKKLCGRFEDLSLLLRFERTEGTIRVHDVVRQYLVDEWGETLAKLHRSFLTLCRPPSGRWKDLAEDEVYLWRHLARHLVQADESTRLNEFLFDFKYLQGKLAVIGANALMADYDFFPDDEDAKLVQGALRLSAHVLARNVGHLAEEQLAGQLFGRLMDRGGGNCQRLREEASKRTSLHPRPGGASLTKVGGPLLRTLEGHTDWVNSVAVLDEKRIVSASRDGTLRVWDLASGKMLSTLEGCKSGVAFVAVLAENRVVCACLDNTLRIWNVESGRMQQTLEGHTNGTTSVAVLDEKRVISASIDHTLRVWNVESGQILRTLKGHTLEVKSVAVLDEKRIVSASSDETLRVWNVKSGEMLQTLKGHKSAVQSVAVISKNLVISASLDRTLRVWNVESGQMLRRTLKGHLHWVDAVAVLDTTRVVSASHDQTLRIWDIESGEMLQTLEGHTHSVTSVAVLDATRIVSGSYDQTLRVWDIESGQMLQTSKGHTRWVRSVAVLGAPYVVSASDDQTLRVWDIESRQMLRQLEGHTGWVLSVAALDATRVVSASADQTVRVWNVESGQALGTLEGHTHRVRSVVALDANRIVSASYDQTIRVWDVESGQMLRTLRGHTNAVEALVALGANRVVSGSYDQTLRVWDVESGQILQTLEGHVHGIQSVAVLDATRVVSASLDQTLRIWDVKSGETIRTLEGHTDGVLSVAVLDANRVVSASHDQTLRVWDVESGKTVAVFTLDAPAWSVAYVSERRIVVAGDGIGGVHFLDLVGPSDPTDENPEVEDPMPV